MKHATEVFHTIFSKMTARTAFTVKKPATTIITTATAKFLPIMLIDEIHPLGQNKRDKQKQFKHFPYSSTKLFIY